MKINELVHDLAEKEDENLFLKKELNKYQENSLSLQKQSDKFRKKIEELNQFVFEKVQERNTQNQQEIIGSHENYKRNINDLNELLLQKMEEIESLQAEIKNEKNIIGNLQSEIYKYQGILSQKENEIRQKEIEKETQFEALNSQFLNMKKEINIANKTIENLESELKSFNERNLPSELINNQTNKLNETILFNEMKEKIYYMNFQLKEKIEKIIKSLKVSDIFRKA